MKSLSNFTILTLITSLGLAITAGFNGQLNQLPAIILLGIALSSLWVLQQASDEGLAVLAAFIMVICTFMGLALAPLWLLLLILPVIVFLSRLYSPVA